MGLKNFLSQWPLIQQFETGTRGTGPEAMSQRTRTLRPKTDGAEVARSICPYCAVGCGQLVYHKDGKLISIEGDPQSPISRGHLCPKGADTYRIAHPSRTPEKVQYRAPIRRVAGNRPREGDGHGRRPGVGDTGTDLPGKARRASLSCRRRPGSPGRSDAR